jgi:hypothetical protein
MVNEVVNEVLRNFAHRKYSQFQPKDEQSMNAASNPNHRAAAWFDKVDRSASADNPRSLQPKSNTHFAFMRRHKV